MHRETAVAEGNCSSSMYFSELSRMGYLADNVNPVCKEIPIDDFCSLGTGTKTEGQHTAVRSVS